MPTADRIAPYLREIDGGRVYSNRGPLLRRLETRLAAHFDLPADGVCAVANGTIGLAAALGEPPTPGTLCLLPAWTFVATGQAVRIAGYRPFLLDIAESDWALDIARAADAIAASAEPVGAVVVVEPFGASIDPAPWRALAQKFDLRLVLDSAAGFDGHRPSDAPSVVSLHATKALGAGEGGLVLSRDPAWPRTARRYVEFGFAEGERCAAGPGVNGKMSEYAAAVALAALDDWPDARRDWRRVAQGYRAALGHRSDVLFPPGYGEDWASSTAVARLVGHDAEAVGARLAAIGVESRAWWGRGLAAHPTFADAPAAEAPVARRLAAETLGLPCFRDMADTDTARVAEALSAILDGVAARSG